MWEQTIKGIIMRIISRRKLREFWLKHDQARKPLQAWYADVCQSIWRSPTQIKSIYKNASFVGNNRVIFNIKGNSYRLIVNINYLYSIVYIRFVGTHAEYDFIDAEII